MNQWRHRESPHKTGSDQVGRVLSELQQSLAEAADPRDAFAQFSRLLERFLKIRKGFLALREGDQMRFLAIASWRDDGTVRTLSLRLPQVASFFEKVAEHGQLYSENITAFFDGNTIERRLLFDDDTVSFMLRPLKHEGQLVGLLGYSSDVPEAFVTVESGQLDSAFEQLAAVISRRQAVHNPS